jgi:hypothetical protein
MAQLAARTWEVGGEGRDGERTGRPGQHGLAENLGYRDQISNRVVDAIGDAAGGVRVSDSGNQSTEG